MPIFDELLNHKELLVKSLSELSEENLCKLGEVLSMLLFRQEFMTVEKDAILNKVATKSNPVFIECLNIWTHLETNIQASLFSDLVSFYFHKADMQSVALGILSHLITSSQFSLLNTTLQSLHSTYSVLKSDPQFSPNL